MSERRTLTLPDGFTDLQGLVSDWALPTEALRYRKRLTTPMNELQAYYDALLPRMEAIMAYLDEKNLDSLEASDAGLLDLALMFMEVSPAIELFFEPDVPEGFNWTRFHIASI